MFCISLPVLRPYWRCYYGNTDAIVYVVDSADRDRLGISKAELVAMLRVRFILVCVSFFYFIVFLLCATGGRIACSLVVFANKQDLKGSMTPAGTASAVIAFGHCYVADVHLNVVSNVVCLFVRPRVQVSAGQVLRRFRTVSGLFSNIGDQGKAYSGTRLCVIFDLVLYFCCCLFCRLCDCWLCVCVGAVKSF